MLDEHRWDWNAWLLDPDFDDLGGNLTFAQICNPQFDLYKSGKSEDPVFARKLPSPRRTPLQVQLDRAQDGRKPKHGEYICRSCFPYNGHHTPNYWGTKQKDIW